MDQENTNKNLNLDSNIKPDSLPLLNQNTNPKEGHNLDINTNTKIIHTLSQDLTDVISSNNEGLVKKIITEEEDKQIEKERKIRFSRINKFYLFSTLFVIFVSLLAILFVVFKINIEDILNKKKSSSLIFHENTKVIDISDKNKDDIFKVFDEEIIKLDQKEGEITGVYLRENKKNVDIYKLLKIFKSELLDFKIDLFDKNFLIGVINNKNKSLKEDSQSEESLKNGEENKEGEENKDELENQIPKEILNDFIIIPASKLFKPNTTEFINEEAKNKAREYVEYFLEIIPLYDYKIKIFGTYSAENSSLINKELAESRKKIGIDLLNEVAKEKYTQEEIKKVFVEAGVKAIYLEEIFSKEQISKMSEEQRKEKINLNEGIEYQIESKSKLVIDEKELNKNTENNKEDLPKIERIEKIVSKFSLDKNLFILFKMNSFSDIFTQMRAWEDEMFYDLHGFFGIDISSGTSYLLEKDFVDGIVQNKNARILYDDSGGIVFMYVYIDDNFTLITNSEETTKEIILRVNSAKIKK